VIGDQLAMFEHLFHHAHQNLLAQVIGLQSQILKSGVFRVVVVLFQLFTWILNIFILHLQIRHLPCYKKTKVVLEGGFFSATNINDLYRHHQKILLFAELSLKLVKTHLDVVLDTMHSWTHYHQDYQLYAYCIPVIWSYAQEDFGWLHSSCTMFFNSCYEM
jgi:hypothetical protein